jgi:hypothetical protein
VTGTNGKTSVASFARQIWTALGKQAASLGTIGLAAPSGDIPGNLTTPDPVALHALLDQLAGEGVTHLALEASSHGLDQRRLDGVRLAAGGFTNLTRDQPIGPPSSGCSTRCCPRAPGRWSTPTAPRPRSSARLRPRGSSDCSRLGAKATTSCWPAPRPTASRSR